MLSLTLALISMLALVNWLSFDLETGTPSRLEVYTIDA